MLDERLISVIFWEMHKNEGLQDFNFCDSLLSYRPSIFIGSGFCEIQVCVTMPSSSHIRFW